MANTVAGLWLLAGLGTGAVVIAATAADVGGIRTSVQALFGAAAPTEQVAVTTPMPLPGTPAQPDTNAGSAQTGTEPSTKPAQSQAPASPAQVQPEDDATQLARAGDTVEPPTLTDGVAGVVGGPDAMAPEPAAPSSAVAAPVVPRFDLLRVEPDGSLVIAGSGPDGAIIEVMTGSTTVARVQAAANGDFAAVLDDPLDPGDYQIVLRATDPDGIVATSRETAVVSIPKVGSNDVLALVEAPGEPSRLITTPGPDTPVLTTVPTRSADAGETEPDPAEQADAQAADAPAPETEMASEAEAAPALDAEQAVELAALPQPDTTQPVVTDAPVAPELPNAEPDALRIEAVEIDRSELFVAGSATAGTRLRLYANEILLGDTVAGDGGRFLVQVRRDLPVGDYIIRADAIDPVTGDVFKRAQVPFTRSAGERLAAIAVVPSAELPAGPPTIPFDAIVTPQSAGAAEPLPSERDTRTLAVAPTPEATNPPTPPEIAVVAVPQALGVLQGPPPVPTDVPVTTGELVPTGQSVIIRRGDTLWQISRRVYGEGIKYTTIYLANEGQIADPDRIWPGQIFAVPEDAMEDAETVHRQLRANN